MRHFFVFLLVLAVSVPAFAKNQEKHKTLPPGLQKKYERTGELPPGWQKKLIKGEVLAPELYHIAQQHPVRPVDYSLEPQTGTELLRIEDRIIRIMNDTKVVLDIFGINTN